MWQPRLPDQGGPAEEGESAVALLPGSGCVLPVWRTDTWGSEKYVMFF